MALDRRDHWEGVYRTRQTEEVSWYQASPSVSLEMLDAAGISSSSSVIDVGGGDSLLVDALLARGLTRVTVLDVSQEALDRARTRTGEAGRVVTWLQADVTDPSWQIDAVDVWHDRAVFHFLTDPADRERYVARLRRYVVPGGAVIIATFALDGPERCSGLPVQRYAPAQLEQVLGPGFVLVESRDQDHRTPTGGLQHFQWSRFQWQQRARGLAP
jgi:2-polyprenyl-3-methyl-5-hydroxy-6-metoxy-1,4-benzoquinol methylase